MGYCLWRLIISELPAKKQKRNSTGARCGRLYALRGEVTAASDRPYAG